MDTRIAITAVCLAGITLPGTADRAVAGKTMATKSVTNQVSVVRDGVRVTASTPLISYPHNALVSVRIGLRNQSRQSIYVPGACRGPSNPHVVVRNDSNKRVFPPVIPVAAPSGPPVAACKAERPRRLNPGHSLAWRQDAILRGGRVLVYVGLSGGPYDYLESTWRSATIKVRLTPPDTPLPIETAQPSSSVEIPDSATAGPYLVSAWWLCPGDNPADGAPSETWAPEIGSTIKAPCAHPVQWHGVVGQVGHSVVRFDFANGYVSPRGSTRLCGRGAVTTGPCFKPAQVGGVERRLPVSPVRPTAAIDRYTYLRLRRVALDSADRPNGLTYLYGRIPENLDGQLALNLSDPRYVLVTERPGYQSADHGTVVDDGDSWEFDANFPHRNLSLAVQSNLPQNKVRDTGRATLALDREPQTQAARRAKPITVAAALSFCRGKTIKRRVTVVGYFIERPNIRGALDGALADKKGQLPAAADIQTNPWPPPHTLAVVIKLDVMLHSNGIVPERKCVLVTGILDCSLPILSATKYPEMVPGNAQGAAPNSLLHTSVWKAARFCDDNPNAARRVQLSGYYQIDTGEQPAGMVLGRIYTLPPDEAAQRGEGLKADIGPLALARQGSIEDGEHMRVRGDLLCSNQVLAIGRFWPLPVTRLNDRFHK